MKLVCVVDESIRKAFATSDTVWEFVFLGRSRFRMRSEFMIVLPLNLSVVVLFSRPWQLRGRALKDPTRSSDLLHVLEVCALRPPGRSKLSYLAASEPRSKEAAA